MINVEFMYNGAAFDHDHVFPQDLEFADLSDDRRKEVLLYASQLMQGNGSLQCFQMACEGYCSQYKAEFLAYGFDTLYRI